MGATAFAVGSIASAGYSIYSAAKKKPAAPPPVLPSLPGGDADAANAANSAALAGARARQRAAAGTTRSSTILTGPQGVTTPAPGQKTLLGM